MWAALRCRWWGHRINRRRVKFDGLEFHTHCGRLGAALVRQPSGWQDPGAGDGVPGHAGRFREGRRPRGPGRARDVGADIGHRGPRDQDRPPRCPGAQRGVVSHRPAVGTHPAARRAAGQDLVRDARRPGAQPDAVAQYGPRLGADAGPAAGHRQRPDVQCAGAGDCGARSHAFGMHEFPACGALGHRHELQAFHPK